MGGVPGNSGGFAGFVAEDDRRDGGDVLRENLTLKDSLSNFVVRFFL